MSTLVNLTPVAATIQGFQVTSPVDMLTALTYLTDHGYTGNINCQNANGAVTWSLGIYDTNQNTSQTAYVDDVIVIENGSTATVVPAAKFTSLYTVDG